MAGRFATRGLAANLVNAGLRGGALAGRFAISLYLVRFMALSDVGHFGLITGVSGLLPSLIGLGFNYFVGREIVGLPSVEAGTRVRDRLCVTGIGLGVSLAVYFGLLASGIVALTASALWAVPVVMLEALFFDLHFTLINLKRPGLANFLLFIRSSLWIAPFIGLSFFMPQYRTLTCLLQFWLLGLILNAAVLAAVFRQSPWQTVLARPIDVQWLTSRVRQGLLIYLSDIGLGVYGYLDRFVVASLLGLAATGVYTFFWTLGNATYVLVTAAVVQIALPELLESRRLAGTVWQDRFLAVLVRSTLGGLITAGLTLAVVIPALPWLGKPILLGHVGFFVVILMANLVKSVSEGLQYGLYSLGRDRELALVNIAGIFVTLVVSFAGLKLFGLWGAAWALMTTALLIAGMRLYCLLRGASRATMPVSGW